MTASTPANSSSSAAGIRDVHSRRVLTGRPALVGVDSPYLEPAFDKHVGDQPPDVAEAEDCDPIDPGVEGAWRIHAEG